jgi:predicted nicotinamide N-methyase
MYGPLPGAAILDRGAYRVCDGSSAIAGSLRGPFLGNALAVTVPEALADPQLRRYRLRRLRLPMGRSVLDLVIPDGRQWMRGGSWVAETERGAEPPYWVEIWPSSVAVSRCLVRMAVDLGNSLRGKRVLDLGCGLGVPGVTAASVGATVSFADMQADALAFAAWNARRLHPDSTKPVCHRIDWSQDVVPGKFEILVLADVSYRPVHHGPLLRHVESCLAEGGLVLHADPFRREADGFLKSLGAMLASVVSTQDTAVGDKRVKVRLTCAARDAALLPSFDRHGRGSAQPDTGRPFVP